MALIPFWHTSLPATTWQHAHLDKESFITGTALVKEAPTLAARRPNPVTVRLKEFDPAY